MKNESSRLSTVSLQRPDGAACGVRSSKLVDAPLSKSASAIGRVAVTTVAVLTGGASSVLACPVCFGAEESSMIDGTKLGVLAMLLVLFAVQGGFVAFFLYLRRRAKQIADLDFDTEWSELQRGSRTS
jgi:hypothetical protein